MMLYDFNPIKDNIYKSLHSSYQEMVPNVIIAATTVKIAMLNIMAYLLDVKHRIPKAIIMEMPAMLDIQVMLNPFSYQ